MLGCCLSPLEQDLVHYLGTLRTDLRLVGAGFFFDFDGADFIGVGVGAFFSAVVALLFDERLLVVFLVDDVLLALLLERPDAFFAVERGEPFGLAGGVSVCASGVDNAARAR